MATEPRTFIEAMFGDISRVPERIQDVATILQATALTGGTYITRCRRIEATMVGTKSLAVLVGAGQIPATAKKPRTPAFVRVGPRVSAFYVIVYASNIRITSINSTSYLIVAIIVVRSIAYSSIWITGIDGTIY